VNLATALPGLITDQGSVTPVPADQVLLHQASSGTLKRATIGALMPTTTLQTAPVTPTGTTSTTFVFMGLGGGASPAVITPVRSGKVFISIVGDIVNNSAVQSTSAFLCWGTGTAPVNGVAQTGSTGSACNYNPPAGGAHTPLALTWLITGLTLNQQIWIDIALSSSGSAAAAGVAGICISAFELP
jgi:hypothetical protein